MAKEAKSKSDTIREVLSKGISKPTEIVEACKSMGVDVEVGLVNSVKAAEKKKGNLTTTTAKPAAAATPAKASVDDGMGDQGQAIVEGIKAVTDAANKVGGMAALRKIVAMLDN